ncbi:GNAT family N-acetyltransferase [Sulfitobacter donghicola]|uniref:Acetyltransferase n=1 Tax=Sulfitobacter donghicola DSW-25 = KCTC 12864 = JCM 14565 TaxID=1300350 RepID=A0A073IZL0_9RHOB|nr:GNAT family N-acetyltransferase [Sulfitobacter donghicola]KEJ90862.1 acetyltransferase [Sulfitobacter donghicola DSW-25 = KCTC 12864 = JCM 14565]KIN68141.1 Acetyltransferase [Sulfitobacter donghicola DSW-25 = KCTC 12864 = JCM 14565]
MSIDIQALYDVIEGTWPPANVWAEGPWTLRDGAQGGKRVSAATAAGSITDADIPLAETKMRKIGQTPLFMIREGEEALDALLAARGYDLIDEVTLYTAPIGLLTDLPIPRVTCFEIWEPLAIMEEIWAQGGVGPARLEVMKRAKAKTGILSRWNEKPAGVAFAAVHDGVAMVHAVEVLPHQRKQGVAQWIMRAAAIWGQKQGATQIAVLCVTDSKPANALYSKMGFTPIGTYHYRILPE